MTKILATLRNHLSDHQTTYYLIALVACMIIGVLGACQGFDKASLSELGLF
jgi:hypothetical protein